ncbi:hypothetical protein GFS24_19645 [Chitinophaga sp. SYP-B3965]|uniref:hypothetical protein n=1 Tax=Chitinophaga sp. SYP-B3965 TaxID=2663120 RepID=UPI0012995575|nr:hypothetical protein [Chitinophaga sp. SYP-B3965]MRG47343.1 hypothetical protein [Chitinophaga sp. SYP-B3965]
MNWKRFTIFLSSLLFCFFADVFSCGPEPDPYDYYPNFYNPNIGAKQGFEPFYYTGLTSYYGMEESEQTINLKEWSAFFKEKVKENDLNEFIYGYTRPDLAALYAFIDKGTPHKLTNNFIKNELTRYFIESKDLETLGYLMYAKQCEAYTHSEDVWTAPIPDSVTMMRLSRNGVQLYKACKDQRIKERFAFQAIRMAHYSKTFKQAINLYDSIAAPVASSSLIHYKALALKAGALLRTGQPAKSVYFFSRIFENAPSQRTLAYLNTGWAAADPQQVMKLCANNSEKATVAAMYAFRAVDYNPEGLKEVYQLDPTSPMLDVLLAREINKMEDGFLYSVLDDQANFLAMVSKPEQTQVLNLQQLLDNFATGGKVKEPALWHTSSAYISFMLKDYAGANKRLATAKSNNNRTAVQDQWEIVRLLVTVNEQPKIDKDFEAKLLESFKWLDTRIDTSKKDNKSINEMFFARMYRNLLDYMIAPRYAKQNDPVKKALIFMKRDQVEQYSFRYDIATGRGFITDSLQTAQLHTLYDGKQQKRKTPYEQYLYDNLKLSDNELGQIIALNYVRQHDFNNAVTWFKRSGSSSYSKNVFIDQLQDFGYEDADSAKQGGISQLDYAIKMADLEKKMKGKNVDPNVYYQYATGLFSISYYGHAYQFSVDYRPSTWWYAPEHENTPFLKQYFGCYDAEEYYKKAAEASTDKEFKAKALFMAARCAQKHINAKDDDWYMQATHQNAYFPLLVKDYSNTEFYKEIMGQCGYLRDFVKAKR